MSAENLLHDEGDLRKYRIELPNLLDDAGLSPFAFRLYAHIKRRCGSSPNGRCFESTASMAQHCRMSAGMVVNVKRELADAGFIFITKGDPSKNQSDILTIRDVWTANFAMYAKAPLPPSPGEHPVHGVNDPLHQVNTPVHGVNPTPSPGEPKKELNTKNKPIEERTLEEEGGKPGHFVPPTRDMVLAYMTEIGIPHETDAYMDYFTGNGWYTGRVRMKDWKATARSWKTRALKYAKEKTHGDNHPRQNGQRPYSNGLATFGLAPAEPILPFDGTGAANLAADDPGGATGDSSTTAPKYVAPEGYTGPVPH